MRIVTNALALLSLLVVSIACATTDAPSQTTPAADVATVTATGSSTSDAAAAPAAANAVNTVNGAAIIGAADRSDADRALDDGRQAATFLDFLAITPGMVIADLGAGGGYTTELLARAVGPTGTVYGQNSKFLLDRFAEKPWSTRLAKPAMANVKRLDREFDAPIDPSLAGSFDVVVNVLFYHDTFWMETDRAAMNANIFAALKPGGAYVIVDHSGRHGSGVTEVKTLHRIEAKIVHQDILAAGFHLTEEADFLRNPDDTRDWNAAPGGAGEKRGTSDRFVLKFTKPVTP